MKKLIGCLYTTFCFSIFFLTSNIGANPYKYVRTSPVKATEGYRLPTNFIVERQDVTIQAFAETLTFEGTATIIGNITGTTHIVTLHSKNLNMILATILVNGVDVTGNFTLRFLEEKDFLQLVFLQVLYPGDRLQIKLIYQGRMNEENHGLYRGTYLNEEGDIRYFMVTQMAPTQAREVFPCLDEPAYKPVFSLKIVREGKYTTRSNMPLENTTQINDDLFMDTFATSHKMPSYLYSFSIFEFDQVTSGIHTAFARPQVVAEMGLDYILSQAELATNHYRDSVNLSLPLTKVDHLAIPDEYMAFSSMESSGIISYMERHMVILNGTNTTEEKQNVMTWATRQISQQWHQTLVTPTWWDNIWLNLALGTFMEVMVGPIIQPGMNSFRQYQVKNKDSAQFFDSILPTRPLHQDAGTPEEIFSLLDFISFEKGAAIMVMMGHALSNSGTPLLYRGMEKFLRTFAYNFGGEDQFYEQLELAASEITLPASIATIMKTWTRQEGYPLITVERPSADTFVVSQSRFLLDSDEGVNETLWYIPFKTHNGVNISTTMWLTNQSTVFNFTIPESQWIIFNNDDQSYMRVNYDDASWNLIIDALNNSTLPNSIFILTRAMLIDDAYNLGRANLMSYTKVMNLISYIQYETDYIPMYSFLKGLTYLRDMLVGTSSYQNLKIWARRMIQLTYDTLGTSLVPGRMNHTEILNRIDVLDWMCKLGNTDCGTAMNNLLNSHNIPADLQKPAYCAGMLTGSGAEWYYLSELYNSPNIGTLQKERVLRGMGCTIIPEYHTTLLERSVSNSNGLMFEAVYSGTDVGLHAAYNFLLDNFPAVLEKFSKQQIAKMLYDISAKLSAESDYERFDIFISGLNPAVQIEYAFVFATTRKNIKRNIKWKADHLQEIEVWLDNFV